ncbi:MULTISPECIES: hypothetical protein [Intestinimonas]|uniref:hypothetical protein n=1 Tax=Intestinimonas TaxID=1392389 RepID=UPI00189EEEA1|nr:hypothetical protein [Intestinimonas butyriciproducens]MBO3278665.1 hypothetical protein [Intestinimonas butyriciproducens]MBS6524045.1 hypothetical protein [Clostridiales bacterium]MCI6363237.1 hypothetical protein [Intestinimonas butyriciproducens]MCR1906098.1 hypothetical protein [Intestinimonas butyriciproducens]
MKRSVCQKVVSTILILACILPSAMLSTSAYSEQTLSPTRRYSMTLKPGETKTLSTPVVVSAGSSVVWLVIWTPASATIEHSAVGEDGTFASTSNKDGILSSTVTATTSGIQHYYLHNPSASTTLSIEYTIEIK